MIEQERIRAEDSGGISLRIRPLVLITLFAALSFLAYAFFGQIFFQREKANPPAGRDLFKRLAIEKPEKVVQAPDFTLEDLSGKRLSLGEITLTAAYKFTAKLLGRFEVRQDWANKSVFKNGSSSADKNQTTLALQAIYGF